MVVAQTRWREEELIEVDLIRRTFRDLAWYWDPGTRQADGTVVWTAPRRLEGRLDRNPKKIVTSNGEQIFLGTRFTTDVEMKVGGWLLEAIHADRISVASVPTDYQVSRQLLTISVQKSFDGNDVYFTGGMA